VTTMEVHWDGSWFKTSTCGDRMMICYQPQVAPDGHYLARMCATPGTITITSADAGGVPTCTATGPVECIDRPFDLPGPSVVEGMLPKP